MDVLSNMVQAIRPGGLVLDLQVLRPDPVVETDGREIRARTWRGREWQVRLVSPPA